MLDFHSCAVLLGLLRKGALELPHIFVVLAFFYVIFEFLERLQELIANKAVSGQSHLELLLQPLIMPSLPKLHVKSFKLSLFCIAIGIDNHQLRKRHYFDSTFTLKHNSKVMMICTCICLVFSVDVVAH